MKLTGLPRKPPSSSFADALRRTPPSDNPYERRLQDADMPRCPLCRLPVYGTQLVLILHAHGMAALGHLDCKLDGGDEYTW